MLSVAQEPHRLRPVSWRQVPESCAQHPADSSTFHQHVLVCGVTQHTSRLREADADKTVNARVPSSLGYCAAVQVTPPEATSLCGTQEAVEGQEREDAQHWPSQEPAIHRDGKQDVVWHKRPQGLESVKPPKDREMRRGIGQIAAESTDEGDEATKSSDECTHLTGRKL